MPSKKYSIQYRYLKTDDLPEGANLKAMTVDAMRSVIGDQQVGLNAKARIIDLDQDGSFVILNKITEHVRWDDKPFSGQLIHLQQGADVAAVLQSLEDDAEEYLLEQVNLGDARVLKGILYFVVIDNHVGLIEGQAVKGRTLERYLTGLFQRHGALEPGSAILLNSSFRAADGKKLDSARDITVRAEPNTGSSFFRDTAQQAAAGKIIEEEAARIRREGATVFDVLATLGWSADAIARLREEIPSEGWIEGFFKVLIKSRNRKKPISRATIDEALRNVDASDLGLAGEGIEKGGLVKLSTQRLIKTEGALQDPADAVEQIMNALRDWAATGKIDCRFD